MRPPIQLHPEVADALRRSRPVVALESAVVTSGLPREAMPDLAFDEPEWNRDEPLNLALGRLMQKAVRDGGAVPAMVAVLDGMMHVGLDDEMLSRLALDEAAMKASSATLAHTMASVRTAGTTVSATLLACAAPPRIDDSLDPIRVFATGGIGGVHRGWTRHPDVSADLVQFGRSPVCVVCAGAKSILDLPATLEALTALGVPVLGYGTECFAQFYCVGTPGPAVTRRIDSAKEAAAVCRTHWYDLGVSGGVLVAKPLPAAAALDRAEVERLILDAEAEATRREIVGDARTPFLLEALRRGTGNRSLTANLTLLASNVRLGAAIACEWAAGCNADMGQEAGRMGRQP